MIENGAAAPQPMQVLDPRAPISVQVARGRVRVPVEQRRRRSVSRLPERPIRASRIRALEKVREAGPRENFLLVQGARDPAARDDRDRRQESQGAAESGARSTPEEIERDDAGRPEKAGLGERARKLRGRDRRHGRTRSDQPRPLPAGGVRKESGEPRDERHEDADSERPAAGSRKRSESVESQARNQRQRENEGDRELLRVSQRERRRELAPDDRDQAGKHGDRERQAEQNATETKPLRSGPSARNEREHGKRAGIERREHPDRLAVEKRPTPRVGVRERPVRAEGIRDEQLQEPKRMDREVQRFGQLHPEHGAVRLRDPQRRRDDLRRGQQRREDERRSEAEQRAEPLCPGGLQRDPQERGNERHPDREHVSGQEDQAVEEGEEKDPAALRSSRPAGRPDDPRQHGHSRMEVGKEDLRHPDAREHVRDRADPGGRPGGGERPQQDDHSEPGRDPVQDREEAHGHRERKDRKERPDRVERAGVRVGKERAAARDLVHPHRQASLRVGVVHRLFHREVVGREIPSREIAAEEERVGEDRDHEQREEKSDRGEPTPTLLRLRQWRLARQALNTRSGSSVRSIGSSA